MAANKLARKIDYDAISSLDWAYLAGIIDGEGCIRIDMMKDVRNRRTLRHILSIWMGNTDPRIVSWCYEVFGGSIHYRPSRNPKHKPAWVWEAHYIQCEEILKRCLTYFKLKREQAEVGLAFRETLRMVTQPKMGIPPEITALRESYRLRLVELKDKVHPPIEGVRSKHLGTLDTIQ